MSFGSIQSIITRSQVLKERGVTHHCQVDKRYWVNNFQITKVTRHVKKHTAHKHKLNKQWSRLMKPRKTWNTINEVTLQRAAAGWVWLNSYMDGRGASLPIDTRIGDAMMSKWVPPCVILHHNVADGPTIASMGNRTWAALGVPLQEMEINGVAHYTFNLRAGVKW